MMKGHKTALGIRNFSLCFAVLFLSGCATLGEFNPATNQREFIWIPTESEVAMGKNIHRQMAQEFVFSKDPIRVARINRIGQKLASVSDRRDYAYHFTLIEKNELNAFTTPGGNIYFFTGLLDKLKSDDAIAAVLAHEIGHCAARHTVKKFQAALGYNVVASLVFSQLSMGESAQSTLAMATDTAMQLIMSAYSRKDEHQADSLGIKYMFLAGYDLNGMIETLKVLEQESHGAKPPVILSTHPYVEDRIKAVSEEIKQAPLKYKKTEGASY